MALVRPAQPIVPCVLALPPVRNAVATISSRITPVQPNVQAIALLVKALQEPVKLATMDISWRVHLVTEIVPLLALSVILLRPVAQVVV